MISLKCTAILDRTTFLVTVGRRSYIILVYKVIDFLDRCKATHALQKTIIVRY